MGSPKDENERYEDEGPQHEVTISQRLLAVRHRLQQALWQAVMGDNPSELQGRRPPVETVTWNDAQAFIGSSTRLSRARPVAAERGAMGIRLSGRDRRRRSVSVRRSHRSK